MTRDEIKLIIKGLLALLHQEKISEETFLDIVASFADRL